MASSFFWGVKSVACVAWSDMVIVESVVGEMSLIVVVESVVGEMSLMVVVESVAGEMSPMLCRKV